MLPNGYLKFLGQDGMPYTFLIKTVNNSTEDALYTVYHQGGKSQFKVNQQMGGGTWILLEPFSFGGIPVNRL